MSNTITNKLIIKLANLNTKLNSKDDDSNIKLIFKGIEDERDPIIDMIMIDEDVYSFCKRQSEYMNRYYKVYGNDICFIDIVDKIVRILLKNIQLYNDIINPKGFMLSYCFLKGFGTFRNRVWSYFNRYKTYFEEMKGHVCIDKILDNDTYSDIQDKDYFESNDFDIRFYSASDSQDFRYQIIKDKLDSDYEVMDIDDIVEENEEIFYAEDENGFLLDSESHPTIKNTVITTYDVPYQKLRIENRYNLLSTEEYDKEIEIIKKIKLRKWNAYRNESSLLHYDVTKYKVGDNYFKTRNTKNSDYIMVVCEPKEFDFNKTFFDKKVETYLKNLIINKLTKRQQLLVGYLYYKMVPVDKIISSMDFTNKTSLDKEKHRALKILKLQILDDYDFIQREYGETYLAFWAKMIKRKLEEFAKKDKKMLSI